MPLPIQIEITLANVAALGGLVFGHQVKKLDPLVYGSPTCHQRLRLILPQRLVATQKRIIWC
jgi:hypothetical protein